MGSQPAQPVLCQLAITLSACALAGLGCVSSPEEKAARAAREHTDRGDVALALRQPEVAERAYRSALAARPRDERALLGLARAEAAQGDFEAAISSYDALAIEAPDSARAVRNPELCPLLVAAAREDLVSDDSEAALAHARRARDEACKAAGVSETLAQALIAAAQRAEPAEATDLYRDAARLDPERADAFFEGASLLLEQGRREEALELLMRGLQRHPEDRRLWAVTVDALGNRLVEQGVSEGAPPTGAPGREAGESPPAD